MPANYLHGVELINLTTGPRPVQVVKSAVISLVGIAPNEFSQNVPYIVQSDSDVALFGKLIPGFNIPRALESIFKQGLGGTVIVVNTFDITDNLTQVTDEVDAIAGGKTKLAYYPVGAVTIKDNGGDPVTWVKDTDYTLDEFGNFAALTTEVTDGNFKFTYKKLNAGSVDAGQINGDVDEDTDARTGMKCLKQCKNLFGFNPKILIAPDYSSLSAVAVEMIAQADDLKAVALLDAPYGTVIADAIAGRGISGEINFNTSSKRAFLLYPYLKAYDVATNANVDYPYSSFMAGVIAATDLQDGFWNSPSNREIKGIVGAERNITAGINDSASQANLLNEVGITTIFNSFGTGIRTWGNRNASWPTNTGADNFLPVLRTADVVHESLENAVLQFIDKPITRALIDAIRETGNQFIRVLIGRGALIPGSRVEFPVELNTPDQIALGKLTYNLIFMPPVPAERITIQSFIDINILKNLLT
jgi:phage tail sheath protein FI